MRAVEVVSGDSDVRRKLFEDGKSVFVICILIENNQNKIIDRDKPLVGEKCCMTALISNGCQGDYGLAKALTDISNGISKQLFFPKHRNQDAGMQICSLTK